MTNREKAKAQIQNFSEEYLTEIITAPHTSLTHRWIEVGADGIVHEAEAADNNTEHYISYPDLPVAIVYNICDAAGELCGCDDCVMYRRYEDFSEEEFVERYDEDTLEYCKSHTHQESLLETANDNGISGEVIQREMLAHLEEIPYGYFSDEA